MKKLLLLALLVFPILTFSQNTFNLSKKISTNTCNEVTYNFEILLDSIKYNKFGWVFNNSDTIITENLSLKKSFNIKNENFLFYTLYAVDTITDNYAEFSEFLDFSSYKPSFYVVDSICPNDPFYISLSNNSNLKNYFWIIDNKAVNQLNNGFFDFAFNNEGQHEIKLIYKNFNCDTYDTIINHIEVSKKLKPNFYFDTEQSSICPNDKLQLNFYLSNRSNSLIDFGDGIIEKTTSSYIESRHSYTKSGLYNLAVSVTNSCGNTTKAIKKINVKASSPYFGNNSIKFNSDTSIICPGTDVIESLNMFDLNFKTIEWKLNGVKLNNDNKININLKCSNINNILEAKITNNCGNDTTLKKVIIVKENPFYMGELFFINDLNLCVNEPINSYLTYNNLLLDVYDKNDKKIDLLNEFKIETPGTHIFKIKYTDDCKNDTLLPFKINVNNSMPFNNNLSSIGAICPGEEQVINLTYKEFNNYKNIQWEIPEINTEIYNNQSSITYSNTKIGTYRINTKVSNYCNEDTILTTYIEVKNNLYFNNSIFNNNSEKNLCVGEEIDILEDLNFNFYTNSYRGIFEKIYFDFGDGTKGINKNHFYVNEGIYNAKIYLKNYCGDDTTFTKTFTVGNTVSQNKTGYFIDSKTNICPNDLLNLSIIKQNTNYYNDEKNIKYIKWDFGDSSNFISLDPDDNILEIIHSFTKVGDYTIKALIFDYCGDSTLTTKNITVSNSAFITYDDGLDYYKEIVCPNEKVLLGYDNMYKNCTWDFGDGQTGIGNITSHSYSDEGKYTIINRITNGCGQDTIVKKQILVSSSANPNIEIDDLSFGPSICKDEYTYLFIRKNEKDSISIKTLEKDIDIKMINLNIPIADSNFYLYLFKFKTEGIKKVDIIYKNECGKENIDNELINVSSNNTYRENELILVNSILKRVIDIKDSVFLIIPSGKEFIWDFGDGLPIKTDLGLMKYKYLTPGLKTVKVKVITGCGDTSEYYNRFQIFDDSYLNNLTSVNENTQLHNTEIQLFPNPVNEEITINLPEISNRKIQITDLIGNILYFDNQKDNMLKLNVSKFSNGMYVINVFNNEVKTNAKFIVSH